MRACAEIVAVDMGKTDIVKLRTPDLVNNTTAIRDLATGARVATRHGRSRSAVDSLSALDRREDSPKSIFAR